MGARTGEEFLKGLQARKREVWLGGERVDDVDRPSRLRRRRAAARRGVRPPARVPRRLPDARSRDGRADQRQPHDPPLDRRSETPAPGARRIAEATVGLMGRTPDYMNVTFAGFAGSAVRGSVPRAATSEGHDNLVQFQKQLAREDISLTHTIVHPTIDRVDRHIFAGQPGAAAQGRRHRARHRRARSAHPRDAGAVRRRDRGLPRPSAAADAHARVRPELLDRRWTRRA